MTSAVPGTKPARRAHVPPVPSGQFPDPGGDDAATRCFRLQSQVADLYGRYRSSIPDGIDPEELRDSAGSFVTSDANTQLHPALQAVKDDAAQAEKSVNDLVNATKVGGDTASLLAAQAYWQRKEKVLDNIKDVSKLVAASQNLVKSASPDELPVLVRELTDYLDRRGAPTDVLSSSYASAISGVQEAYENATVKARQRDLLTHNHSNLQRAFQKDTPVLPLFDPATATAKPYTNFAGG
jgi:hypothetical protein